MKTLLLVLACVFAFFACTPAQKAKATTVGQGLIDCATTSVEGAIIPVAGVVLGGSDVTLGLENLGLQIGEQALACGVKAVIGVLSASNVKSEPISGMIAAQAYVAKKQWHYKGSE